ncbi:hypothetical protein ACR2XA_20260 [Klebsiella pneumoniae]
MNIETVNELIASLESAGELSIRETKVMALAKAYQQLAAESMRLKKAVIDQIKLKDEIRKAGTPPHSDFWIQSICMAENEVEQALNGTHATDRIVAGIKADGVEMFVEKCREKSKQAISSDIRSNWWIAGEHADDFAKQLREVADK